MYKARNGTVLVYLLWHGTVFVARTGLISWHGPVRTGTVVFYRTERHGTV